MKYLILRKRIHDDLYSKCNIIQLLGIILTNIMRKYYTTKLRAPGCQGSHFT